MSTSLTAGRATSRSLLAVVVAAATFALVGIAPRSAAATTPDLGSVASAAAPSCWYIKQVNPAATDGKYWLQTPVMVSPQQFYCDMTTDGGGYVLVGRGREGWSFFPSGQRSATDILSAQTGVSAFPPAALSTDTINGLLNGGSVTDLPDGIVLKRAAAADGSSTQMVKWHLLHLNSWSWSFVGGQQLASSEINGVTYTGGNTKDDTLTFTGQVGSGTGSANNSLRVNTTQASSHNYQAGFAYGKTVAGVNSPSTYLWTYTNENNALPFTQVFIRPQLSPFGYPPVPDAGLPATTLPPIMKSTVEPLSGWGVTGVIKVGDSEPQVDSGVLAFAQVGNTVFVGGKFTTVQQGAAGQQFSQPYIAAFDKNTGAWIDTFRPVLDGTVWHMAGTPDGKLIVSGQFTNVNGVAGTTALAELDPTTGAVVDGWRANLAPPNNTTIRALARSIDIEGGWVYVGGLFSSITGPAGITRAESSLGRVRLSDGEPDTVFRPVASGQVYSIDATPDRLYAVGKFADMNNTPVNSVAVLSTADGSLVPGMQAWQPSNPNAYQQTIMAVGNEVWQGGSEHMLHIYSAADYSVIRKFVTADSGGDFQSLAESDGFVYGSGHFSRFAYTDGAAWPALTSFTRADKALYVGAWDEATHTYQTGFTPVLHSRNTEGIWALMTDSSHCLWFGGDLDSANSQWIGGFGKYCEVDHTAPTTPSPASAVITSKGVQLTWGAASDNSGSVKYEVLRNDRVIQGAWGVTNYTDPYGSMSDRYFVRAVDAAGNRSATTPLVAVSDTTAPTTPTGLAASLNGSDVTLTWGPSSDNVGVAGYTVYRNGTSQGDVNALTVTYPSVAAGTYTYQVQAFDASGNRSSKTASVSVTVTGPDTTPPATPKNLTATLNGSDATVSWSATTDNVGVTGYTVYRNGVSIGDTTNLSVVDPALPPGTYAYQAQAFDAAGNRSAKTASVSVTVAGPDVTAPSTPKNLAATLNGSDATLTWSPSTDNVGVTGYTVYRNGVSQGDVTDVTATYAGLSPGTYAFQVQAFDAAGNRSAKTASVSVTVNGPDVTPPSVPQNLAATVNGTDVMLTWSPSTDNVGVAGYTVYRNGVSQGDVPATTVDYPNVTAGSYSYQVQAFDAAGNRSAKTASVAVTVTGPDTTAPSVPKNVAASVSGNDVTLTWTASTDNVGVAGYTVYRNGVSQGDVTTTSDVLAGLPNGTFSLQVQAFDAAGNRSSKTAPISVTTPGAAPFAAPHLVAAKVTGSSAVALSWKAPKDSSRIVRYLVYRDGRLAATVTGSRASLSHLTKGLHQFVVRAEDARGRRSGVVAVALRVKG